MPAPTSPAFALSEGASCPMVIALTPIYGDSPDPDLASCFILALKYSTSGAVAFSWAALTKARPSLSSLHGSRLAFCPIAGWESTNRWQALQPGKCLQRKQGHKAPVHPPSTAIVLDHEGNIVTGAEFLHYSHG